MKILKGLGKLILVSAITAGLIWSLNFTVKTVAVGAYKEGIKKGYSACKNKQTGVFLDTRGLYIGEQPYTDNL